MKDCNPVAILSVVFDLGDRSLLTKGESREVGNIFIRALTRLGVDPADVRRRLISMDETTEDVRWKAVVRYVRELYPVSSPSPEEVFGGGDSEARNQKR